MVEEEKRKDQKISNMAGRQTGLPDTVTSRQASIDSVKQQDLLEERERRIIKFCRPLVTGEDETVYLSRSFIIFLL